MTTEDSIKLKNFLDQRGQAIFELILFLPLLIFLYTIYYTVGNAISGSINQQKAVRGYFYTLVKGNSYVVSLGDLQELKDENVGRVGFKSIGWRESEEGKNSIAPCFKFSSLLKNSSTEECNSQERDKERSSRFIRLFTVYGVCGATFLVDQQTSSFTLPQDYQAIGASSCSLGTN